MPSTVLPTSLDQYDLSYFVTQRLKLQSMSKGVKKFPHIYTHCVIKLTPTATTSAFFEPAFADNALDVEIVYDREYCQQISCNSHIRGGGKCTVDTAPSVFISYDQTHSQCEPACWVWGDEIERTDKDLVDSFFTVWNEEKRKCVYGNQALFEYFTDPISRSEARWEHHVNTLPTGFAVQYNAEGKISGSLDPVYCDEFNRTYTNGKCKEHLFDKIVSFTPLGSSLISLSRSAIKNNWEWSPRPYSRQPDRSQVSETRLDKKAWLKNVDAKYVHVEPNVILSDVGFSRDMLMPANRGAIYFHNKEGLVRVFNFYESVEQQQQPRDLNRVIIRDLVASASPPRQYSEEYVGSLFSQQLNRMNWAFKNQQDPYTLAKYRQDSSEFVSFLNDIRYGNLVAAADENDFSSLTNISSFIWDRILGLLKNLPTLLITMVKDWTMLIGFATDYLSRKVLTAIKNIATAFMDECMELSGREIFTRVSGRLLGSSLATVVDFTLSRTTTALAGRMLLLSVRTVAAAVDFLNVVGLLVFVADLLWMTFEPFGFSKSIDQDQLNQVRDIFYQELSRQGLDNLEISPLTYQHLFQKNLDKKEAASYVPKGDKKVSVQVHSRRLGRGLAPHQWSKSELKGRQLVTHTGLVLKAVEAAPAAATARIPHYDDDSLFMLSISNVYFSSRLYNSLGHPFDWGSDEIDISGDDKIVPATIPQSMLSNQDVQSYFDVYNYRQLLIVAFYLLGCVFCLISIKASIFSILGVLFLQASLFTKFTTDTAIIRFAVAVLKDLF